MATTIQGDLIIPEVFAGEIQKKMGTYELLGLVTVEPFTGSAGVYTVTKQSYLGDAIVLGENEQVPFTSIKQTKETIEFVKLVQGVEISDEADLNSVDNPVEDSSSLIANTLDGGIENLIYETLGKTKISKEVIGLSKFSILEAFKSLGKFTGKKTRIVVNTKNYLTLQQNFKTPDDSSLFSSIAGTEIFEASRLQDDEFYVVQDGGLKLKYTKMPNVEKGRNIDKLSTKVVGSTIVGIWIHDDAKIVHVTILPEEEVVEEVV